VAGRVRRGGRKAGLLPHALRLQAALSSTMIFSLPSAGEEERGSVIRWFTVFLFVCANSFAIFQLLLIRRNL
jgi:hypothetical protein